MVSPSASRVFIQPRHVFVENENSQTRTVSATPANSLYLRNCTDGEYTVTGMVAKILIEQCKNVKVVVEARVLTSLLEVWRVEDSRIEVRSGPRSSIGPFVLDFDDGKAGFDDTPVFLQIKTEIHTLQSDMCKNLSLAFTTSPTFQSVAWTKCDNISVSVPLNDSASPQLIKTGLTEMCATYPDTAADMDQFIIHWVKDELKSERVVRVGGYAMTEREDTEWVKRQDRNARKLAETLLTSVGPRQPPVAADAAGRAGGITPRQPLRGAALPNPPAAAAGGASPDEAPSSESKAKSGSGESDAKPES
ncbi:hypothetical protein HK104_003018 [Borealophlyctis nickersoniae]|nr:hypothetical protein HK104_003018 [Borealophlyctis nickersoniae]